MSKRYREALEEVELANDRAPGYPAPASFRWRGRRYRVLQVLGHWREDPGWWQRSDGRAVRIQQADLWRVEARNGDPASHGVYELVRRDGDWHLDRVWD